MSTFSCSTIAPRLQYLPGVLHSRPRVRAVVGQQHMPLAGVGEHVVQVVKRKVRVVRTIHADDVAFYARVYVEEARNAHRGVAEYDGHSPREKVSHEPQPEILIPCPVPLIERQVSGIWIGREKCQGRVPTCVLFASTLQKWRRRRYSATHTIEVGVPAKPISQTLNTSLGCLSNRATSLVV